MFVKVHLSKIYLIQRAISRRSFKHKRHSTRARPIHEKVNSYVLVVRDLNRNVKDWERKEYFTNKFAELRQTGDFGDRHDL